MNLSTRTRSGFRSGPDAIPYRKNALERDLERVRDAWDDCQTDRRRDAIYGYLKAVYDLVYWWSADGVTLIEHAKPCGYEGCCLCHAKTSLPR
jgi:hypothetical protein